jgi:hypothetical protein
MARAGAEEQSSALRVLTEAKNRFAMRVNAPIGMTID